ncbi:ABC transporter transmembrane domain-containing protein [Ruegeria sp. R14_0]|uniref:ABC transporter transmembrane domain-containing protein n=1 Tax=Ruegeria sp. R14_0 TaxID=2821100 RepID=UPI001ADC1283|nr:ABC transporter transmembrane domain-containing protein [Ruegeria sp. R14_0]MBO9447532.1 ATP-binding cassette domain-containing protein [Ruegeria sp. R14_0]
MEPRGFVGRIAALEFDIPLWVASLSMNVLSLLMPISILLIFDRVIPFQSSETLRVLTVVLVVGAVLELLLRHCRAVLLTTSAENAAVTNYRRFMTKVLNANTRAFSREPASSYAERYSAIGQLRDYHSGQNQTLSIDLPFTVLFIATIGLIGGWLILVPLGALCVVIGFAGLMRRGQWHLFKQRKSLDTRRYAFLSELLSNMPTVKANRMEPQMARRFEMLEDQTVGISRKLIQFSGFAQSFGAVFSQVAVAAMGLLGAYLVIVDLIGIAELAACMLLNGRIIQPLTKLMALWVQSENAALSKTRLAEIDAIETHQDLEVKDGDLEGRIDAIGLSLRGPHKDSPSFVPVTFHTASGNGILIEAAESWMVSALYDAITGQRAPDVGDILIDGAPAVSKTGRRGRNAVVVLEEEPAIFSGTLLENLSAFGDADTVARARRIAAALGLENRVYRLPMGYATPLNTGSVFEADPVNRQLIALTRALALQPRVILMNEPTAVLDTPERQALAEYMRTLSPRVTLIMASPDPRMKQLTNTTVRLSASKALDLAAWAVDADLERTALETWKRGAA